MVKSTSSAARPEPTLRPYQIEDLNEIIGAFNDDGFRRVLYQLPTGGGKTVIFADLIRQISDAGECALVLAHRDEIMQQVSESLMVLGVRHGIVAPGYPETAHRVQVASVFTLVRRLHLLRSHEPQLVVVDEAHHCAAETWKKVLDAVPDADILGVTATPRRLDGKPLDAFFDELIVGPPIARLIDDGWLSPVQVFTPPHSPDLKKVHIRAGDYAIDQAASIMSGTIIVNGAVREYQRLCPNAPAIAFCVTIEHSKLVADAFRRHGYRAEHLDGSTSREERRDLIAALNRGDVDILTNCGIVSEGLDVPGVEAAILLRPTRSLALYLQMVGRALRPGKELAFVLDHAGNVYRHGLPTARRRWSLHGRHQQHDGDGASLIRCPDCGAMNPRHAGVCQHCGAELRPQRQQPVEVSGTPLVETIEYPVDDFDLQLMSHRSRLRWCADNDGRLMRERLERVARAKGYAPGWVYRNVGKHWETVWAATQAWRKTL